MKNIYIYTKEFDEFSNFKYFHAIAMKNENSDIIGWKSMNLQ